MIKMNIIETTVALKIDKFEILDQTLFFMKNTAQRCLKSLHDDDFITNQKAPKQTFEHFFITLNILFLG